MARKPNYMTEYSFPAAERQEGVTRVVPGWAIIGIFLILLFNFITSAAAFLMPVTLGILLFFVFVPFRRLLGRIGVPAGFAAAIVTIGLVALVGVLGFTISGPISDIVEDSPRITQRLEDRFSDLRESMRPLEEAAAKIDEVTNGGDEAPAAADDRPDPIASLPSEATTGARTVVEASAEAEDGAQEVRVRVDTEESSTLETLASAGPSVAGQIVFTLFLLFFLLASGDLLYLKVVQSFDTLRDKRAAYMAMREIESSLGSYLGAITLINAGLGICIGLAMWFWEMPQPLLWGIAAFILNFIPYLGAVSGVVAAFVVAIISFDDIYTPILVAATYMGFTAMEGQLITPYFVSRRLRLNTVVVFVTVALWAWLWSVLGMVVAVPMLVVLKVIADHIPRLEKFGNFLAGEAPPALEDEDEEEARDLVEAGDESESVPEARADTAEVVRTGGSPA
ncbi:Predicted PurR-regulated permease PerM [Paracoccus isoporae]|uniref:Predicted PurR-regulated permease PerM n=1 Tax=Paracoccus isoporae TaxID=591205 RepID=A0A1G7DZ81_9RHOB|nr:AI-2E family transporter [Paracoccus isoporae]SDE56456.1 Predicted PurR-regulated permease PerM [Paracoccus isoporae]